MDIGTQWVLILMAVVLCAVSGYQLVGVEWTRASHFYRSIALVNLAFAMLYLTLALFPHRFTPKKEQKQPNQEQPEIKEPICKFGVRHYVLIVVFVALQVLLVGILFYFNRQYHHQLGIDRAKMDEIKSDVILNVSQAELFRPQEQLVKVEQPEKAVISSTEIGVISSRSSSAKEKAEGKHTLHAMHGETRNEKNIPSNNDEETVEVKSIEIEPVVTEKSTAIQPQDISLTENRLKEKTIEKIDEASSETIPIEAAEPKKNVGSSGPSITTNPPDLTSLLQ